jgi:hypothetical protein
MHIAAAGRHLDRPDGAFRGLPMAPATLESMHF